MTPIATRTKVSDGKTHLVAGEHIRHCPGHGFKHGDQHHLWRGGACVRYGYRYIHNPSHPRADRDGYVAEHRSVVERHLGRHLEPTEHVHHVNGIKLDNRIENLVVLTKSAHHLLHREVFPDYYASLPADEAHRLRSEAGKKGAHARWKDHAATRRP